MSQVLFLFSLQALGILFALPFKHRIPFAFCLVSGLLWGLLFWTIISLLFLIVGIPYNLISTSVGLLGLTAMWATWNIRKGYYKISRSEALQVIFWLAVSFSALVFLKFTNLAFVSPDSLIFILNGRVLSDQGLTPFLQSELSLRGVMLTVLQAASGFVNLDYLYALQPAVSLSFCILSYVLTLKAIRNNNGGFSWYGWVIGTALIGFLGTYYVLFQFFYIHNNLLSGIYLSTGVMCLFLALQEKNSTWAIFGALSFLAFSLLRTESPLFMLIFILLFISSKAMSYSVRLWFVIPLTVPLIAWYFYLLMGVSEESYILNPSYIWLIIASLAGTAALAAFSEISWVKNRIFPVLPSLLCLAVLLLAVSLVALDAARMQGYFNAFLQNMTIHGQWGFGWFILAGALLLVISQPAIPNERLFTIGLPVFFCLVYLVSTRNVYFQLNWGDSANRMLMHIYPLFFMYLAIKFGFGQKSSQPAGDAINQKRSILLFAGFALLSFILLTWFMNQAAVITIWN